jgi:hypothetical protein
LLPSHLNFITTFYSQNSSKQAKYNGPLHKPQSAAEVLLHNEGDGLDKVVLVFFRNPHCESLEVEGINRLLQLLVLLPFEVE